MGETSNTSGTSESDNKQSETDERISHLIGIVGKINVTTGSSLYYNLRCMVTKLTPYNLNVNGNSNNEWLVTNTKINALLYPW